MEEIETDNNKINKFPILTIWFRPRKTIRHLLKNNVNKYNMPLAMCHGMFFVLSWANKELLGNLFPFGLWGLVLLFVASGTIIGPIRMYIFSFLFKWTGSLLHGEASRQNLHTAFSWSSIPILPGLFIWFYLIFYEGHYLFGDTTPYMRLIMHIDKQPLYIFLVLLGVWRIIILILNVAEAHQFSVIKSIVIVIPLIYADLLLNVTIINYAWKIQSNILALTT